MNNPLELTNELVAEAFADYRKNQAYRIDEVTEAKAHDQGARGRQPQA
jgi:xanthine dehydrogenase large subunit